MSGWDKRKRKKQWDGDEHLEITPWEFVLTYLTVRERKFLRNLLATGDYESALNFAKIGGEEEKMEGVREEFLSRPWMECAIRRTAWLAKDPRFAARILMPYIVRRQLEIALSDKNASLSATKEIAALSGTIPAQRSVQLRAEMTSEMVRGELQERPWVDKRLPWARSPGKQVLPLFPAEVDTPREEVEAAVDAVLPEATGESLT